MNKITLQQQLDAFDKGIILDSDGKEDKSCNFFDWFCKRTSLKAKSEKLFKIVKRWAKNKNVDTTYFYCIFKNNCPLNGPLYDDFRICDIETGDVIWTVIPKSGLTNQAEIWGYTNDFKGPIVTGKNMNEIFKQSF